MDALALALSLVLTAPPSIPITAAKSGVNGAACSTTPKTLKIDMEDPIPTNQLAWTLTVTPGSTTSFTFKCYESETGLAASWGEVPLCESGAATNCKPDVRTYTLSDFETLGSVKIIPSRWFIAKKYALCKATCSGTGTFVMTGARSWQ